MLPPLAVQRDISELLSLVVGVPSTFDELGLLRVALRRYCEIGDAAAAVAWAAEQISAAYTGTIPHDHR